MTVVARRSLMFLLDVAILSAAFWAAFFLRFDGLLPLQMWKRLLFTWPYVVAFQYVVLYLFAVPQFAWRYVGLREASRVGAAIGVAATVLLIVRLMASEVQGYWAHSMYALIPGGVILGDALLAWIGIIGVRASRRLWAERWETSSRRRLSLRPEGVAAARTLLIGAGEAGAAVARNLALRPDLGFQAVGFLDDDRTKLGLLVHGLRVLGPASRIAEIAAQTAADHAIITIASARGRDIRRIVTQCEQAGVRPKIVPAVHEVIDGQVSLSRIRDVSIEDLLGREPVELELDLVRGFLEGKRVLITGAGGSIGSELCRQVARFGPASLALVEQAEFALFTIHEELKRAFPNLELQPTIGDVCDTRRVEDIFGAYKPQVVFHAAAHKHVPMMEWNPGEAVKNNVFGTRKVADAADRHQAEAFVMISTDKAVNPTSIMGATKRVAEMYVQALSRSSSTKYVAVRFGNVLGSTGSVIPTFKAQIEAGGPVTVTHPEMKRYFMTIPEASQLVMQAAAMGEGGEIYVLDMGEPVKIVDLAESLIRLSGFRRGEDIEIVFTGIRPGEKLFEELAFDAERMDKTRHDKIFVGKLAPSALADVTAALEGLTQVTATDSVEAVRKALRRVVPEMRAADASSPAAAPPILVKRAGTIPPNRVSAGGVLSPAR